jgi:hypothetical protein
MRWCLSATSSACPARAAEEAGAAPGDPAHSGHERGDLQALVRGSGTHGGRDYAGARQVLNDMLSRRDRLNGNEVGQVYNMLGFVYFSEETTAGPFVPTGRFLPRASTSPRGSRFRPCTPSRSCRSSTRIIRRPSTTWSGGYAPPTIRATTRTSSWARSTTRCSATPGDQSRSNGASSCRSSAARRSRSSGGRCSTSCITSWKTGLRFWRSWRLWFAISPKREYWMRFAGIHGQDRQRPSLAVDLRGGRRRRFLEQQGDFTNYAGLLMQAEVPFRAARVLEKRFRAGRRSRRPT